MSGSSIDEAELLAGTRLPSTQLAAGHEQSYLDALLRIMRGARLNSYYPDARAVSAHLGALHPKRHGGLYPGVDVDERSGLPTYREWTRVQTDVALATDQLHQLGERAELAQKAREKPGSVFAKQLQKYDYYKAIEGIEIATLGDMTVKLRRVDSAINTGHFHVVLDKLDASGLFVRYSIDLAQNLSGDTALRVERGDVARQSEAFQALIYQFTSLDSEMTFAKIATAPGMTVERVIKGVVGPILFHLDEEHRTRTPEPLEAFVREHGWLATFSLDQTAYDIEETKENDPFVDILGSESVDEETRERFESARGRMGYKVFKDRKFVVPRSAVGAMRALCEEHGTRNIVYGF